MEPETSIYITIILDGHGLNNYWKLILKAWNKPSLLTMEEKYSRVVVDPKSNDMRILRPMSIEQVGIESCFNI